VQTAGDTVLQGWTVNLEDTNGSILATALSDSSGNFAFTDVGAGTYEVAQVVQTGWVQTRPFFPTSYSFTVRSNNNLGGVAFGDSQSPALAPSAVIDNGQDGYSESNVSQWDTADGGFDGTNRVARTVHSSNATATATWDFTGVANAQMDVWVTWVGKSGYSRAAPFGVYDGGTGLGTQSIDESVLVTQSQGGRAKGSYGGVGWLLLGTFTISSGELKVVLSNLANSIFVDADGVLITPYLADASVPILAVGSSAGTKFGTTAIGTADILSSTPTSTGAHARTVAPTHLLDGAPALTRSKVIYDAGALPSADPYAPLAIDAVLHRRAGKKTDVRTL
jgi:hypothetical protein